VAPYIAMANYFPEGCIEMTLSIEMILYKLLNYSKLERIEKLMMYDVCMMRMIKAQLSSLNFRRCSHHA
jgi:hypothetical protein